MWSRFFQAGGPPMYPVAILGLLLVAASVLYLLRPEPRMARVALTLGLVTFAAGLLGAVIGICLSLHYVPAVAAEKQLAILALGVEESLHDVVLALMIVVVAGLIAAAGHLRRATVPAQTA
jgi:hypothetical protein